MDAGQIGGLCGGVGGVGMAVGALLNRFYSRGRHDGKTVADTAVFSAAIVRIEMSVAELTRNHSAHVVEDAGNFGELKASVRAMEKATEDMRETMRDAADSMRALTERLDNAITRRI